MDYFLRDFPPSDRTLAHLARCAAAILALPAADSLRRGAAVEPEFVVRARPVRGRELPPTLSSAAIASSSFATSAFSSAIIISVFMAGRITEVVTYKRTEQRYSACGFFSVFL